MFPQPKSRPEFRSDDSYPEAVRILEQHRRAGFPPDLALDLVLNVLVVRAAEATHATAAALALLRNGEMICRASSGHPAPDLGFPINPRDGLSGACLKTHQAQLCADTELDPRVEPAVSRYLGIRSILIVPVFDINTGKFTGILEVFSSSPAAFSGSDQKLLEGFAEECARIRQAANEPTKRDVSLIQPELVQPELVRPELVKPVLVQPELVKPDLAKPELVQPESAKPESAKPELAKPEIAALESGALAPVAPQPVVSELIPPLMMPELREPELPAAITPPVPQPSYEGWTLVLGALTVFAIISVSFLIGSRIGWLRFGTPRSAPGQEVARSLPPEPVEQKAEATAVVRPATHSPSAKAPEKTSRQPSPAPAEPAAGELVVYEKGKVIFRMKSAPAGTDSPKHNGAEPDSSNADDGSIADASSPTQSVSAQSAPAQSAPATIGTSTKVWISPSAADTLLLTRTEPQYPAKARAAHRSGNVVLEVLVAEDGSVSKIRTLSGDPALAAAAKEAVRNWRYQPYRQNDHPAQFQTDVTLSFALPN